MKVLVIDDDMVQHRMWEICLKDHEAIVWGVATGKAGLQEAITTLPDFIVIDFVLPDMGGLDLLSMIRDDQRLADKPIIITTASIDPGDQWKIMHKSPFELIIKPVTKSKIRELYNRIEEKLANK